MEKGSVRLVDVTLRDGGKVNDHSWTLAQAERLVEACAAAAVPDVEIGYFRPARQPVDGATAPAASCPPEYLEPLREKAGAARLMVMTSRKDAAPEDLAALARYGVAAVNMPARAAEVASLGPYARAAHDAGMRLAVKLMRVNRMPEQAVLRAVEQAAGKGAGDIAGADVFYLADSYGGMFPEDVTRLAGRLREVTDVPLGLHAHDGLSMAFANSVAAVRAGVEYVDASLSGMGVDGGNLCLELFAAYLRCREHQGLAITPLARAAAELLTPWLGEGLTTRAEYVVIGMLDLDPKDPASVGDGTSGALFSLLDAVPVAAG
ncbi:hypothetical protein ACWGCW_33290 [Streptomyces sp. NPDC054933]